MSQRQDLSPEKTTLAWVWAGVDLPYEEQERLQPAWDIPSEVVIMADLGHDTSAEQAVEDAIASARAGACAIHLHIRDDDGNEVADKAVWREAIEEIRSAVGNVVIDRGPRGDTFDETVATLDGGLFDLVPIQPLLNPSYVRELATSILASGSVPEIVIRDATGVSVAKSELFETDTIPQPAVWLYVPDPPFFGMAMPSAELMVRGYMHLLDLIRAVDPDGLVIVCAAGRASNYVTTQALLLGQHIRPGRGETPWRYPHAETRNAAAPELVSEAATVARILGRAPATSDQFRAMIGRS
jgi:uncharacterized protein (DUF849 family)